MAAVTSAIIGGLGAITAAVGTGVAAVGTAVGIAGAAVGGMAGLGAVGAGISAVGAGIGAIGAGLGVAGAGIGAFGAAVGGGLGLSGAVSGVAGGVLGTGTFGTIASGVVGYAGAGAFYGGVVGGISAGATGQDIGKGIMKGATTGAVTGLAGGVGGAAGSFTAGLTEGSKALSMIVGASTGAGLGYGGARLTGASGTEAALTAATAGIMSGGISWGAASNVQEWNQFLKQPDMLKYADPNFKPQWADFGMMSPRGLSEGALKAMSLVQTAGGILGGRQQIQYPMGVQEELSGPMGGSTGESAGQRPGGPSLPEMEGSGAEFLPDRIGAGMGRGSGDLFGGVESLMSSMPKMKKTQVGVSDDMLLRNGAMIGV